MIQLVINLFSLILASGTIETPGLTMRIWDIRVTPHDLPQLEPGQHPNDTAVISTLDLTKPSDFLGHDDNFYLLADADLTITEPGVYEFQLNSDDGSELWIAGTRVVDNGGLHPEQKAQGQIALDIGRHPIQVKFFQGGFDAVLQLLWKPPLADSFVIVPRSVLTTNLPADLPTSSGPKSIVREKSPRVPGHGAPLVAMHPGMDAWQYPLPALDGHVTAMTWSIDGSLLALTDQGSLWTITIPTTRHEKVAMKRIAEGLDNPGGIVSDEEGLWIIQSGELTHLRDTDEDGVMDEYLSVATGWPVKGRDQGSARGLLPVGDSFLFMLTKTNDEASEHRGTVLMVSRDGTWEVLGDGLHEPIGFTNGIGMGPAIIDQQAFSGIVPMIPEVADLAEHGIKLPPGSLPHSAMWIESGPWKGHLLVADGDGGGLKRLVFDQHDTGVQGAVFRASQGFGDRIDHIISDLEGRMWLIAHNATGPQLFRIDHHQDRFQIHSLEGYTNGLLVTFTEPVEPLVASDPSAWMIHDIPMTWGDDDVPPERIFVDGATVLPDRRSVFIETESLRDGSILHLQLVGPWFSEVGQTLYSNECWYSMHRVPERSMIPEQAARMDGHNQLTPMQEAAGWTLLFDGKSMDQWRGFGKNVFPEGWLIEDGQVIRAGPAGDIITREQYDDFEFSIDWKVEPGGNSGVFFNVSDQGNAVYFTGPEMQLLDNKGHPDGGSPLTSAGSNYALHPARWDVAAPAESWNRSRLVVRGNAVEHWLNGVLVVEYLLGTPDWSRRVKDSKFRSMPDYGTRAMGHIALQDHGEKVSFRNMRIRRLNMDTLE